MPEGRYPRLRRAACLVALCVATAAPSRAAFAQSSDLAGRISKLEQTLSNRGLLDLLQEVENLKREVAGLRGELETQAFTIEQLKRSHAATYSDLDSRLRTAASGAGGQPVAAAPALPVLEPTPADAVAGAPAAQGDLQVQTETTRPAPPGAIDATVPPAAPAIDPLTGLVMAPPAPAPGTLAGPGEMAVQPAPPGVQDALPPILPPAPLAPGQAPVTSDDAASEAAYRDAFALLKSGEYDRAIAAFDAFQQQYPNSQYGDNAQFWLAEAHYVKRDFVAALAAYEKMLTDYPASKKLSHAMLKIGYSYSELGQVAEARAVLSELQQRFPGSAAAQLAEQRIAQLPAN